MIPRTRAFEPFPQPTEVPSEEDGMHGVGLRFQGPSFGRYGSIGQKDLVLCVFDNLQAETGSSYWEHGHTRSVWPRHRPLLRAVFGTDRSRRGGRSESVPTRSPGGSVSGRPTGEKPRRRRRLRFASRAEVGHFWTFGVGPNSSQSSMQSY